MKKELRDRIMMMLRNAHSYNVAFDFAPHFKVEEIEEFSLERANNITDMVIDWIEEQR